MTEGTEHFHPALIQFSRTYNATYDNMDFTLMYGSKDGKKNTVLTSIDAVLEGLSGTILHQQNALTIDSVNLDSYIDEWRNLTKKFSHHIKMIETLIQLADKDQTIDDILGGYAQEKAVVHKDVSLWSNIDTTLLFEPQVGVGYHQLKLSGTSESIQEALLFVLYQLIREHAADPETQQDMVQKLVDTEIKRMIRYKKHPDRFNTYILPWITTLQSLD